MRSTAMVAAVTVLSAVAGACGSDGGTASTTTTSTIPGVVSTSTSPPIDPTTTTHPVTTTTLPYLPLGPDLIEYRGGAEDLELTGPDLISVAPDGTIAFVDPVGHRIMSFGAEPRVIDLLSLDILGVAAFVAGPDGYVVVEVSFGPVRHRIHRLSMDGSVIDTVDLPEGARLEDGLSGVMVDDAGDTVIVIEGGRRYAIAPAGSEDFVFGDTVRVGGHDVRQDGTDLVVDGRVLTADLVAGLGGMSLVGVSADGVVVVKREEVTQIDPSFEVLVSVEWYSADGDFLGSAPVDLESQAISTPPGLAVTPDGRVVELIAGTEAVEVVELVPGATRLTGSGA